MSRPAARSAAGPTARSATVTGLAGGPDEAARVTTRPPELAVRVTSAPDPDQED